MGVTYNEKYFNNLFATSIDVIFFNSKTCANFEKLSTIVKNLFFSNDNTSMWIISNGFVAVGVSLSVCLMGFLSYLVLIKLYIY